MSSRAPIEAADEPPERLRLLLEAIVDAYGLEGSVRIEEDDERLTGIVDGEDLGLLIGRHGQTIDALEHVAARIAYRGGEEGRKRVAVDAAGYRARRAEALERQAEQAVAEAVKVGRPVALDAMTAAERRLVHEHLRDRHDVETHSEGDEPDRRLVVSPVVATG